MSLEVHQSVSPVLITVGIGLLAAVINQIFGPGEVLKRLIEPIFRLFLILIIKFSSNVLLSPYIILPSREEQDSRQAMENEWIAEIVYPQNNTGLLMRFFDAIATIPEAIYYNFKYNHYRVFHSKDRDTLTTHIISDTDYPLIDLQDSSLSITKEIIRFILNFFWGIKIFVRYSLFFSHHSYDICFIIHWIQYTK